MRKTDGGGCLPSVIIMIMFWASLAYIAVRSPPPEDFPWIVAGNLIVIILANYLGESQD